MARSKYINTFNTTAEYNNYIDSALPEFPNVGYDKQASKVNIRRQSPNNYQIWGTTTLTSNFNIKLNNQNVEVTVDPQLGEFYLTGWTGTLSTLINCFQNLTHITSIKKFALDVSNVINMNYVFSNCSSITSLDLSNWNCSNVNNMTNMFNSCSSLTDVYITIEATLMKLTKKLTSQSGNYIPSSATIHYNDVDYKWQNNAWTAQS